MSWRMGTIIVMAVTATILLGWDVIVAFFNKTPNSLDTESGIIKGWFMKGWWVLAWAWGMLGGHFFMPGVFWKATTAFGISALVLSAVGLLLLGLWATPRISQKRWRVALRGFALMQFGILEGWLFFPQ